MFVIEGKVCTKGKKGCKAETVSGQISRDWSEKGVKMKNNEWNEKRFSCHLLVGCRARAEETRR